MTGETTHGGATFCVQFDKHDTRELWVLDFMRLSPDGQAAFCAGTEAGCLKGLPRAAWQLTEWGLPLMSAVELLEKATGANFSKPREHERAA